MKLLQLIPDLSSGGAERFVVDLSNKLTEKHDVTLLTLFDLTDTDIFEDQVASNVKTESLGKELGFDFKVILKLYNAIKRIAPDVIHNHLRSLNYLIACSPILGDIPIVHTVHNDAFEECSNRKIRFLREQFFRRQSSIPVTISQESTDSFTKAYRNIPYKPIINGRIYPEKTNRFSEVKNEISGYQSNNSTSVFVNIGRIVPQKNQSMLVGAFNKLVYEHKANAILLIIGREQDTEESQRILRHLQRAEQEHNHIHILGERSNATDYLHAADFFCLSSLYEGMPISFD